MSLHTDIVLQSEYEIDKTLYIAASTLQLCTTISAQDNNSTVLLAYNSNRVHDCLVSVRATTMATHAWTKLGHKRIIKLLV